MQQTGASYQRIIITITGRVQGVGFRPYIYRLAEKHGLVGSVSNTCTGVHIDVQGAREALSTFQHDILHQKPERATILELQVSQASLGNATSFTITSSVSNADRALALLPDTAMCQECLHELFDPKNRRYHYPFLHCISCGPRFSLFVRMPFDRSNTTMTEFSMCEECQTEYRNPENRRFYSQTNCCPTCGPELQLVDAKKNPIAKKDHAIDAAAHLLQQGKIIAMKNTGGYLLLVDATNEQAVKLLRLRKRRTGKPFAMLMPSLKEVEAIAQVGSVEKNVLTSHAAPIVLLRKKPGDHFIAFSVAHESPYYGVMLPHNPLQHLLLHHFPKPLVATSGNISGIPLCISEEEAFASLSAVADAFLTHNRKINHRLDDSIVHVMADQPVIMRKARGYTPSSIPIQKKCTRNLFAAGSHMKNSFAFSQKEHMYMSQHIGDLDSVDSCTAYENEINSWENLLGINKFEGVGDKHPDYYSSLYLQKRNFYGHGVQHHKAHVLACMVDNGLSPPFVSVAWDGTGLGDDGTVWGGEAFLATEDGIRRTASLLPFLLPGGEKAVQEPRRSLLGFLHAMGDKRCEAWLQEAFSDEERSLVSVALTKQINTPLSSSMGRLFDAVSALLGLCLINDFEGQAALLLEQAAYQATTPRAVYAMPLIKEKELTVLDWRPMIEEICRDKARGISLADISMAFHETLAQIILALAKTAGQKRVLLTGGVMQNKLLVEKAVAYLRASGYTPYIHRDIPPNDGGIAVGQVLGRIYTHNEI